MKKIIYITAILSILVQMSPAQQEQAPSKWNYSLGIGLLNTKLKNDNINEDETLITNSKNHPLIEFSAMRKLGNNFGVTMGITFLQYSTLSHCGGIFISTVLETDTDGFYYHAYYDADFTIERKVSTIGIPVGIKVLAGQPGKTRFQLETGIQPSFAISSQFKQDGHFIRKGLYNDQQYYNVHILLEDIPRLNYGNNDVDKVNSSITKSFLLNYCISAGISAPISAKTDIYIKGYLTTGLNDITPLQNQEVYVNFMGQSSAYKKTTLFAEGIAAGIVLR